MGQFDLSLFFKGVEVMKKLKLWVLWLILGVISLLYFAGLLIYTGFTNKFYLIWGLIGCFFLLLSKAAKAHWITRFLPGWLKVTGGIIIGIGAAFFILVESLILSGFYKTPSTNVDYVIVLGAHVKDGKPSRVLTKRLDAAYDYAMEHTEVCVIVSGGQGANETTTEAYAMALYLEEKGLEPERIIKEEKATDTVGNLTLSLAYVEPGKQVAVVSNDFHIYRALQLAKEAGYDNPQGLSARDDFGLVPANMLREFFGVVKDTVCGNMKLLPIG